MQKDEITSGPQPKSPPDVPPTSRQDGLGVGAGAGQYHQHPITCIIGCCTLLICAPYITARQACEDYKEAKDTKQRARVCKWLLLAAAAGAGAGFGASFIPAAVGFKVIAGVATGGLSAFGVYNSGKCPCFKKSELEESLNPGT
jgi:hypothetical protein